MTPFMRKKAMLMAQLINRSVNVADAFSTDLYTGNGSTQTITNGIDLSGEGGLVWIKSRLNARDHQLVDSVRGDTSRLETNTTNAESIAGSQLVNFRSDGHDIPNGFTDFNASGDDYVNWTFRQAPKFFDIVQYTGDGTSGRQIAHDLGIAPGMVTTKSLSTTGDWNTYHRSATGDMVLNTTAAQTASKAIVESATDSTFTVSGVANSSSVTYIAYLFAHDPDDSGIIQCGSYTGNGSTDGPVIDLGWQPQWLLFKSTSNSATSWIIIDSARGMVTGANDPHLLPNNSQAESSTVDWLDVIQNGYKLVTDNPSANENGGTYIYCAIKAE